MSLVTERLAAITGLSEAAMVDAVQGAQDWLLTDGLRVVLTLVLAVVARWAAHRLINRVVRTMTERSQARAAGRRPRLFAAATGSAAERQAGRVQTIGSLLRSVASFVIVLVTVLTVMALVGIPLGPLLASAGVGGVALGFGAQSLVKDFLAGVFMVVEDQYGVGDVIDTGEAIGTVEEVGLRVTRLRDADGVTWYVRNGEVIRIGNRSQGHSTALVDMPVSYDEDVDRVLGVIRESAAQFGGESHWQDRLIEPPEVLGVETITGATMTIRVIVQCVAGEHFAVQRELRERLKTALDAAGVKAPPVGPFGPMGGAR
ncbi:MAG: mechanosensitive ion channel family protein [Dermatophilaceae bacterium]